MPKKRKNYKGKMYFMGVLTNVDASILKVKLKHGFEIEEVDSNEYFSLVTTIEQVPAKSISAELIENPVISEKQKIYLISNSFGCNVELDEQGRIVDCEWDRHHKFTVKLKDYLKPVLRLMRLYKEGNICMPFEYTYIIYDNTPKMFTKYRIGRSVQEKYTLKEVEISQFQKYIHSAKLPDTGEQFLTLAFYNFELSYKVNNPKLAFLTLMIALEGLFSPTDHIELRYRVARGIAVFLGENKEDSKSIFKKVKKIYDIRSKLVHGSAINLSMKDVQELRYLVRESIKDMQKINKTKVDIQAMLDCCAFGDRKKILHKLKK